MTSIKNIAHVSWHHVTVLFINDISLILVRDLSSVLISEVYCQVFHFVMFRLRVLLFGLASSLNPQPKYSKIFCPHQR